MAGKIYIKMKPIFPLQLLCAFAVIVSLGCGEDLIFFADDHYKAVGMPEIVASVADPVLAVGKDVLVVTLANDGRLEELIPISGNGSREDISREMAEEMHGIDALDITATLAGTGPVGVDSGPQSIESLPAGSLASVAFNLTVGGGEGGWTSLPLRLDYERQVDVSVSDGEVSPLLLPANATLEVKVLAPSSGPLRVLGTKSDLAPGKSGDLMIVIKNDGPEDLHNCSARLEAMPPFRWDGNGGKEYFLGDINSGALAVASFSLSVDGDAALQDFQLGCRVNSREGRFLFSFPLALDADDSGFWLPAMIAAIVFAVVVGAAFIFLKRKDLLRRRRRRW